PEAVARLKGDRSYVAAFKKTFNEEVTAKGIAKALSSFQRARLNGSSRVDAYESGQALALNAQEALGRALFHGKARCAGCHLGPNYTDEGFHNTGFLCTTDFGLEEATGRSADRRLFKTPTLRAVGQTSPYMHDGSVDTLEAVVELYNAGGPHPANRDTEMRPLGLTAEEKAALVQFLKAL
ncbi:MAG TPA: cytochrome c peroxidase, partial [Bdellovibrionales bacterium]|nr:cytochrome c peroxidase [Bdellovibrionales bacterium]